MGLHLTSEETSLGVTGVVAVGQQHNSSNGIHGTRAFCHGESGTSAKSAQWANEMWEVMNMARLVPSNLFFRFGPGFC